MSAARRSPGTLCGLVNRPPKRWSPRCPRIRVSLPHPNRTRPKSSRESDRPLRAAADRVLAAGSPRREPPKSRVGIGGLVVGYSREQALEPGEIFVSAGEVARTVEFGLVGSRPTHGLTRTAADRRIPAESDHFLPEMGEQSTVDSRARARRVTGAPLVPTCRVSPRCRYSPAARRASSTSSLSTGIRTGIAVAPRPRPRDARPPQAA